MAGLAFVFPGQGSQTPGMGRELYHSSPAARAVLDQAEAHMPGLLSLCFDGPMEQLTPTIIAQPALFAVGLAAARAAMESGIRPDAVCGFSLGEWTALCLAGVLDQDSALDLVIKRGQWMQACALQEPGGMSAVLRLSGNEVNALLTAHPQVLAVNYNAPDQTVVAGPLPALASFEAELKAQGKRFIRLNVAGAFHSPLMSGARQKMAEALSSIKPKAPSIPVISNVDAKPYHMDTAFATLASQIDSPVRFVDCVFTMDRMGISHYLELGPGRVLGGLIAKIKPDARYLSAADMPGIRLAKTELEGL